MFETVRKPTVALATFGTLGDLHPFVAVALALKRRGIEPIVAAAEGYRANVEGEGLRFQRMRPDLDAMAQRLGMGERELARAAAKRPDFIVRDLVLPHLREAYEDVMDFMHETDLIVTHSVAYGAQIAAERAHVPRLGIVLQPMMLLSSFDPPIFATSPRFSKWLYRRGPTWTRFALGLAKRVARTWAKPVDSFRRELGLPAATNHPLFEGSDVALGTIALYSSRFGPPQPDHPPNTAIVGFAFYDRGGARNQEALERFLSEGDPPIVFTQGTSAVHDADTFIREGLAAANMLDARAVFALDEERARYWGRYASSSVFVTGYAPYSTLFPHARAIVHHGGIGTTAQALRSGRPQLIAPYLVDQPDNAHRVERLGCGRVLGLSQFRAARVAAELRALTNEAHYARRAADVSSIVASERGAEQAADIIADTLAMLAARGQAR